MLDDNQPEHPLNIIIVDDEANIRKMLTVCLETRGHRVTAVGNPQDAQVEAIRQGVRSGLCGFTAGNG